MVFRLPAPSHTLLSLNNGFFHTDILGWWGWGGKVGGDELSFGVESLLPALEGNVDIDGKNSPKVSERDLGTARLEGSLVRESHLLLLACWVMCAPFRKMKADTSGKEHTVSDLVLGTEES